MSDKSIDIDTLAYEYKQLVVWVGIQLVLAIVGQVVAILLGNTLAGAIVGLIKLLGILVTAVALGWYAYGTAGALGSRVGLLWAIAMVVPLVNVITLLVLSSKATRACRARGIPVGLFGPKQPKHNGLVDAKGLLG